MWKQFWFDIAIPTYLFFAKYFKDLLGILHYDSVLHCGQET
jgi:hypothetical protein